MAKQTPEEIRKDAVRVHDQTAGSFEDSYTDSQGKNDIFLYGRERIDEHFERAIEGLGPDARILDIGCGVGYQIMWLKGKGFGNISGIEPSDVMREYAGRRLPGADIRKGSILELPFEDNRFDLVYSLEVLRYLNHEDNARGLSEVHRVLKPGGIFFGTFVNRYSLDFFYVLNLLKRMAGRLECHTEFETPGSLSRMLTSAGFSKVDTCGAMFAFLRVIYKLSPALAKPLFPVFRALDRRFNNIPIHRPFAGHLIGIARK